MIVIDKKKKKTKRNQSHRPVLNATHGPLAIVIVAVSAITTVCQDLRRTGLDSALTECRRPRLAFDVVFSKQRATMRGVRTRAGSISFPGEREIISIKRLGIYVLRAVHESRATAGRHQQPAVYSGVVILCGLSAL